MQTYDTTVKKRTDYDQLTRTERRALQSRASQAIEGAIYIGTDAEGAMHFFSMARRKIAVFDDVADTDPFTVDLRTLPIPATPRAWAERVHLKRGPWQELRVGTRASAVELEV